MSWTDWTSITPETSGSGTGTMTFGSETVGVSLYGLLDSFIDGTNYYAPFPSTYGNLNSSDVIQEWNIGSIVINFSKPVKDPYMALVSVGASWQDVSYSFSGLQNPIVEISNGGNYWGFGSYSLSAETLKGVEYNGVLKFPGTYNQLAFTINNSESWHGFNVGAEAPVPEPTSMVLGLMGLAGVLGFKKRK